MAEKPILLSTLMVKAILDGRKGMTRRKIDIDIVNQFDVDIGGSSVYAYVDQATGDSYEAEDVCPYQPGDILWVRETWASYCDECESNQGEGYKDATCAYGDCNRYAYKADDDGCPGGKWRPSIHMPKEAARIWLEVTDVRVERLQEITVEDVIHEGLEVDNEISNPDPSTHESIKNWNLAWAQHLFRDLWDSINAKRGYGWDMNPWVWVISFRRVEPCD